MNITTHVYQLVHHKPVTVSIEHTFVRYYLAGLSIAMAHADVKQVITETRSANAFLKTIVVSITF